MPTEMNTVHPRLISIEGISGSGKTHLCRLLREQLGNDVCILSEATDGEREGLGDEILQILMGTHDQFFRSGSPLTETALLLALKAYDYESVIRPSLNAGRTVIEDRSVDTVAVYQSIIQEPEDHDLQRKRRTEIYACSAFLRPLPDITLVLLGDTDVFIERAATRNGRNYSPDEVVLLKAAASGYEDVIGADPSRVEAIQVSGRTGEDIAEEVIARI